MKTFLESLTITKNTRILEQLVVRLEYLGIDSNEFLDWYIDEGINLQKRGFLTEGFNQWALEEGWSDMWNNVKNRWTSGKSSGQSTDNTSSNTMQNIRNAGERTGQFIQKQGNRVGRAIGWMRDAGNSFNRGLQGDNSNAPGNKQMTFSFMGNNPSPSVVAKAKEALSNLSKRIMHSKQLKSVIGDDGFEQQITDLLTNLQSVQENFDVMNKLIFLKQNGLDVEELVEIFIQERLNINEGIGDWFGKVGDWFKGQWANVKHAWNTWGEGKDGETAKRDKEAVNNAFIALQNLQNSGNNEAVARFKDTIDQMVNKINSIKSTLNQASPAAGASPPQSTPPQPAPQPAPNPGAASNAPGVTVSATQQGQTQQTQPISMSQAELNAKSRTSESNEKFLESLMPKSNKFSWFGY